MLYTKFEIFEVRFQTTIKMPSILSYAFARFIDILLLIAMVYGIQKNLCSGMTMNIEDPGNPTFILTISFLSYFSGYSQSRMDN